MATLRQAQLSDSMLTSNTINKSKLIKCTLINVTLHNSDVADSVLKNCIFYDCVINSSKFHNCKIYGNQLMLRYEFKGCELVSGLPGLSKLPVEVREMIFKLALAEAGPWNGKTPSLIAALRPQKKIYLHALDIFQKTNTFSLHNHRQLSQFNSMPKTVLSKIKRIKIRSLFAVGNRLQGLRPIDIQGCFRSSKNLTEMCVTLHRSDVDLRLLDFEMDKWMEAVFSQCKSLQTFALFSDYTGHRYPRNLCLGRPLSEVGNLSRPISFKTKIEKLSYSLGIDANEKLLSADGARKIWTWNAAGGKTLTWKKV